MNNCKYPIFKELINKIFECLGNPEQKIIAQFCDLRESSISNYRFGRNIPNDETIEKISVGFEKYISSEFNRKNITIEMLKVWIINFLEEKKIMINGSVKDYKFKFFFANILTTIKNLDQDPIPSQRLHEPEIYSRFYESTSIRDLLIRGSKTNYKNIRGAGGRFYHLNISDTILPKVEIKFIKTNVKINDESSSTLEKCIEDLWKNECWHAFLIGHGGMGKTVSLLKLWEKYLNSNNHTPVPIFISLSEYNNAAEIERRSFIFESIGRNYLGQKNLSKEDENLIWDLLKVQTENNSNLIPSVLLLLDGINELSVDKTGLLIELNTIKNNCKGVQVIITSRTDLNEDINSIYLKELDDFIIQEYLQREIPKGELLKLIRNPMMLTIYSATSHIIDKVKNNPTYNIKSNVQTSGEMLWNFIESQLIKKSEDCYSDSNLVIYRFLLSHLLPYIGWHMELKGKFYLMHNELVELVNIVCEDLNRSEFFDTFYYCMSLDKELHIGRLHAKEERERFVRIKEIVVDELAVMVQEKDTFSFLHQNFRDFFAAVHILNELKMDLTLTYSIAKVIKDYDISYNVRKIIGEIEGEHYNVPRIDKTNKVWSIAHYSRNILFEVLDICRGKFNEKTALAVRNVIEIWKNVRGELTGADLSNLDLSKVNLNMVRCSRLYEDTYTAVNFDKSLLYEHNILFQGHSNSVNTAIYSSDGKKILTCSADNTIKELDVFSGLCIKTYRGHSDTVNSAIYSPDGKKVLTSSDDCTIREWDIITGECIKKYEGHLDCVSNAIYSPDGKKILSISLIDIEEWDAEIKEWEITTGKCIQTYIGNLSVINTAIYSNDGKKMLSTSDHFIIKEWNVVTGEYKNYEGHTDTVNSAVYSCDDKKFLSASSDRTIKEWDTVTGKYIKTYEGHTGSVNSAIYSPDGKKILSASHDNTIKEWDVITGECIKTYEGHTSSINSAIYSPDGKKILSASWDKTIKEWDVITGECIKTYEGHSDCVNSALYRYDGKKILSASNDYILKEWDTENGECTKTDYSYNRNLVSKAVYSSDCKKFLNISNDYTINEIDNITGECTNTYKGHLWYVNSAIYSPDGKKVLSASWDKTIKEWNAVTGECIKTYKGHTEIINSAIYSIDGKRILSVSQVEIKEWDTTTGECIRTYRGNLSKTEGVMDKSNEKSFLRTCGELYIKSMKNGSGKLVLKPIHNSAKNITYSICGKKILTISELDTIKEWDIYTGECIKTYEGHWTNVSRAVYSNDGKKILSASHDDTIKEWDVITGECVKTYEGHSHYVNSAIYSNDGKKILSASHDNTIKEWDIATGEYIKTYEGHSGWVNSAIYSPDGKKILSVLNDNTIKEWDVATGECINTYRNLLYVNRLVNSSGKKNFLINDNELVEFDTSTNKYTNIYENNCCDGIICSNDGRRILLFEHFKPSINMKEFDSSTGECIRLYKYDSLLLSFSKKISYSYDRKRILIGYAREIKELDTSTGNCIKNYEGHSNSVNSSIYSADGKKILSASDDNTIKEWDVATGKCIKTYVGHINRVNNAIYSPDGEKILSVSDDNTIKEWDVSAGKCIKTFESNLGSVYDAIYSSDGKKIISESKNSEAIVWDIATGQCIKTYDPDTYGKLKYIDGKRLLFDCNNSIKEWDVVTDNYFRSYDSHSSISSIIYSSDGKNILSVYYDNTFKVWDTVTGKCLLTMEYIPGVWIYGCSFRELHPESKTTDEFKKIIKTYGAIVD